MSGNSIQPLTDEQRRLFSAKITATTKAENTRVSYASDWAHFQKWADVVGVQAMPASEEAVIAYLLYWGDPQQPRREGDSLLSSSTLSRRVVGIRNQHRMEGAPIPESKDALITEVMKYVAIQQRSVRKSGRKKALTRSQLDQIVESYDQESFTGVRNRSLLLLTFYSALRRSSVTDLMLSDVEFGPEGEGIRLYIAHSKTDQRGEGRHIYISGQPDGQCPVDALRDWLTRRGHRPGPLYVNQRNMWDAEPAPLNAILVNRLVKDGVAKLGLDPSQYGAHSLRSGFATQAARDGVEPRLIREQTGHKSYEMLDRYIQDGTRWNHNATRRPRT